MTTTMVHIRSLLVLARVFLLIPGSRILSTLEWLIKCFYAHFPLSGALDSLYLHSAMLQRHFRFRLSYCLDREQEDSALPGAVIHRHVLEETGGMIASLLEVRPLRHHLLPGKRRDGDGLPAVLIIVDSHQQCAHLLRYDNQSLVTSLVSNGQTVWICPLEAVFQDPFSHLTQVVDLIFESNGQKPMLLVGFAFSCQFLMRWWQAFSSTPLEYQVERLVLVAPMVSLHGGYLLNAWVGCFETFWWLGGYDSLTCWAEILSANSYRQFLFYMFRLLGITSFQVKQVPCYYEDKKWFSVDLSQLVRVALYHDHAGSALLHNIVHLLNESDLYRKVVGCIGSDSLEGECMKDSMLSPQLLYIPDCSDMDLLLGKGDALIKAATLT
eukprot:gene2240-2450_t